MVASKTPIVGVLLAGGLSRRMGGGDKSLMELGGDTILARVVKRAQPQVKTLILNANGDPGRFEGFGLPVVEDVIGGFAGPLAGILTGMTWTLKNAPEATWMASFATDAPFLPENLVARLVDAVENSDQDIACAMSAGRTHPVFALWRVALKDDLRLAMEDEDMRKIDRWTSRYRVAHVDFDVEQFDPFFNVNRPENLDEATKFLIEKGAA
ncbi:MAG: molybdenum cofactor guanylyltransferase MobA [Rhodospirillaceae bacterium]|jgi:molybdenum cofactor guanylyltransferase|nr:molybdenum cofactor guanylyltransferase MobA [Rhodospirillaceae bacterium]MBT4699809.1 molybdenum cofactor guanylyltransferase MobA [Rhodospirillaceae bacterium]MBT6218468.1 molybdenum cofactor guanylyltransferase MobA [Rhodospirillaceae bacterium]MBT6362236.1 molybdenum cofactor guanylyltransferase MobA [Rhodospirillaceae bacterium]